LLHFPVRQPPDTGLIFTESLRDKSPHRTILALKLDAHGQLPDRY